MIYLFRLPDPLRLGFKPAPRCVSCGVHCEAVAGSYLPGEWMLSICPKCVTSEVERRALHAMHQALRSFSAAIDQVSLKGFLSRPNVADQLDSALGRLRTAIAVCFQLAESVYQDVSSREARSVVSLADRRKKSH